jgi:hypothetical protein
MTGAPPGELPPPGATRVPPATPPPTPLANPSTPGPDAKKDDTPAKKKDPGTDLVIHDLATDVRVTLPEVVAYAWNKDGSWLAYTVSSAKKPESDGAYARRSGTGSVTRALLTGRGNYKNLTWDEAGAQLAFVSDRDDYKAETPAFKLYCWTGGAANTAAEVAAASTANVPKNMVVSDSAGLDFSARRPAFVLRPRPRAQAQAEGRARAGQRGHLELERSGTANPAKGERRNGAPPLVPGRVPRARQAHRAPWRAGPADHRHQRQRPVCAGHLERAVPAARLLGRRLQRRVRSGSAHGCAQKGARKTARRGQPVAGRQVGAVLERRRARLVR